MSVDALLRALRRASRRRAIARAAVQVLPWLVVGAALGWRLRATPWWWLALLLPSAAGAWWLWRAAQGFDTRWLAQALDARRPDMEDSAALLFAGQVNELQALQRARLQSRIGGAPTPDLRTPWRAPRLLANATVALAIAALLLAWRATPDGAPATSRAPGVPATAAQPARLVAQAIEIRAPGYTGLPVRNVATLAARAPEGSTLHWRLRFAPEPASVGLLFHDGRRLSLRRAGGQWRASLRLDRPMLYRIVLAHPLPAAQAGPHRLDVVRDRAPGLRALQPARSLSLVRPGQRHWDLAFEASDDYGLAAAAQLRIIRTEGSGENITAREQAISLRGRGGPRKQRFSHRIDLATLGMVEGDDVIVQLSVRDRRTPTAQVTRGANFILRWPAPAAVQSTGLDGLAKKTLPAYFRSQRQIIIDAEALLQERRKLAPAAYIDRSDAIGVDQRLLRLRYGQFLGEESEGTQVLPTNDGDGEPARADADDGGAAKRGADAPGANAPGGNQEGEPGAAAPGQAEAHEEAAAVDGHDHGPDGQRAARFGEDQAVLEKFGHTHDIPEAATLLDPATRTLLRAALDEMWQSELRLRQGQPGQALPFANRALRLIKQVQQAERIYLPRLGTELPPIDPGRRLGGDRAGLGDRGDPIRPATGADPVLADAWRALAPRPAGASADLAALSAWLGSHAGQVDDPLAVAEALDAVRRDEECAECRRRLRALLWPMLRRPPAAAGERMAPDRAGAAYLDALGRGGVP